MKDQTPTRRIEAGYLILVFVIMIQELLLYIKVYMDQTYTTQEMVFSLGTLAALLIGFFMPVGVTAVLVLTIATLMFRAKVKKKYDQGNFSG